MVRSVLLALASSLLLVVSWARAEEIRIGSVLVLARVGESGRAPVFSDAVEASLVAGTWAMPAEGDEVVRPGGGTETWRRLEADENGQFGDRALAGGWAVATVTMADERVMLLEASGHRSVYVNGEPRVGDVYGLGTVRVPVLLRAGENVLLFRGGRGGLRARLVEAPAVAMIEGRDATLPDVVRGEAEDLWGGVIVTNTTGEWMRGLRVRAVDEFGGVLKTDLTAIAPLASFKAPVRLPTPGTSSETAGRDEVRVRVELIDAGGRVLGEQSFALRVRDADQTHVRTFVSGIDGSVQYYAVTPPPGGAGAGRAGAAEEGDDAATDNLADAPLAMILTLHGASVEGSSQAAAYTGKDWAYIVAPTNRRPYGFDWEDWGRLDAMEVLDLAEARFGTDPMRTYLTGHSMGGHGTWSIGAMLAPRFAAIAPSAGWRDFWSYTAGGEPEPATATAELLWRASSVSRTLLMERNYSELGVYVLHGDADDNVPVSQARFMRERLGAFHSNFGYYERAGAGHWWGNECVDWPALMAFLRENRRAPVAERERIEFVTVDPGVSSQSGWVRIEDQIVQRDPSRVVVIDAGGEPNLDAAIAITTENVSRLRVDLAARGRQGAGVVAIDGQNVEHRGGVLQLMRDGEGAWRHTDALRESAKRPERRGPFKDAFRHRVLFVVGTGGTAEENAWALAKARYDAETFWYRGNGAVEITTDREFDEASEPDRSVVLYGHRAMNLAWDRVLGDSPVVVERGRMAVGERVLEGEGLACLVVRPRRNSAVASVGVVAGTGMEGLRLTNQLPYFLSGAHYPDWIVLDQSMLSDGGGGWGGVVGCGFFDGGWLIGSDQAWRE